MIYVGNIYAGLQRGGGTVNTANGISGDGSVATPVILGGTLDEPTTALNGTDVELEIQIDDGVNNLGLFTITNTGADITGQSDQNDSATVAAGNTPGTGSWWNAVFLNFSSRVQALSSKFAPLNAAKKGIQVNDNIDNIGLIGNVLYVISGPDQYAQYGNLSQIVGKVNTSIQSGLNTSFTLYAVPAGDNQLLRVNPAIFLDSIGATTSVIMTLQYTDQGGVAQTVTLATLVALTTPTISAQTIYAQKGTNVVITVVLNAAGAQYQVYATCEYLGIQN